MLPSVSNASRRREKEPFRNIKTQTDWAGMLVLHYLSNYY